MASEQAARTYHSPLRERRAEQTRALVLEAVAAIITEQGTTEFSMQEVADRADVSLRTVYRYFPSRQDLLDGLDALVSDRMEELRTSNQIAWDDIASLDELLATIPEVFAYFDRLEPLSTAMTMLSAAGHRTAGGHDERTTQFRRLLADHLTDLDPAEAEVRFAVIRHLMSSSTWHVLHHEFGLSGQRAGDAVAHAVTAILEAG